jgi:hypothetical protein
LHTNMANAQKMVIGTLQRYMKEPG